MAWPEKTVLFLFALVSAYLVFIGSLGNPNFGSFSWFGAFADIEARVFGMIFFPIWIVLRAFAALIARS